MNDQFSGDNVLELLDFLQYLTKENIEDVIQDIRHDPNLNKFMQDRVIDLMRHALKHKEIPQSTEYNH